MANNYAGLLPGVAPYIAGKAKNYTNMDAFDNYYNMDGEKISWEEVVELRKDWEKNYKVAQHKFEVDGEEVFVSTVLLLTDLGWKGHPIIFETMIFGGKYDSYCERYTTKLQALKGHHRAMLLAFFDEGGEACQQLNEPKEAE